eukprot:gnl/TRDRNA2_/TRDRNA2_93501_c0_seq1.p1 gnl/TRDRNA2_/TRDRNA2_93501_c0~~gnl/TRDRNA2_/TRDRNA2_93501_c0_seq1.p1  ORF type:complete len:110 (-),score=21.34 gnl/TRDRNA2_/TRDRNA2_93501_c0_seq1:31-360(-)
MFVDGYSFDAYKALGFKSITELDDDIKKQATLDPPGLSFGQWMKYLGNVMKVSPVPADLKFGQFPEGVLRLGGTFVVRGQDVMYQWCDRLPGDHPDIGQVIALAKDTAR